MADKKLIGVLGGMGHSSTCHVFRLMVEYQQSQLGCVQDEDFYKSVIYNTALTEWDNRGFVDAAQVKKQLIIEIQKLETFGCDIIIIPCNTVHYFLSEMQSAVKVPIVNMVEQTALRAEKLGTTIGLLSSRSTRDLGIYDHFISRKLLKADDEQQAQVDEVILAVQAGWHPERNCRSLESLIQQMMNRGADRVILGCTELSIPAHQSAYPVVDSSKVLVETLFRVIA